MQDEELLLDPEEQTEQKLVNNMAKAIVAVVAGLILFLAIRPWIQRYREEHQEQEGAEASPEAEAVAGK